MGILYEKLNEIWFNKPKPVEVKKLNIYDILIKRKALELSARINGYEVKYPTHWFSAHNEREARSWQRRSPRNGAINQKVDCLYKQAQIKNFFPKLTRPDLKQILLDFTQQNIDRQKKKEDRIELLRIRRCARLLPLTKEKYEEYALKSKKHAVFVEAIKGVHKKGYHHIYRSSLDESQSISTQIYEVFFRLDEKRFSKPNSKELKYA